eukprot:TRINITY_DN742_c3_g1_i3.p2 TRINITY_DN742_c3_g1~~TRINITY_DN742_c3_g1_i3.p2  ORF type:complete len:301 (+),score=7.11 TRINITY_DN742_c3_g1_i3:1740-2642(+)
MSFKMSIMHAQVYNIILYFTFSNFFFKNLFSYFFLKNFFFEFGFLKILYFCQQLFECYFSEVFQYNYFRIFEDIFIMYILIISNIILTLFLLVFLLHKYYISFVIAQMLFLQLFRIFRKIYLLYVYLLLFQRYVCNFFKKKKIAKIQILNLRIQYLLPIFSQQQQRYFELFLCTNFRQYLCFSNQLNFPKFLLYYKLCVKKYKIILFKQINSKRKQYNTIIRYQNSKNTLRKNKYVKTNASQKPRKTKLQYKIIILIYYYFFFFFKKTAPPQNHPAPNPPSPPPPPPPLFFFFFFLIIDP